MHRSLYTFTFVPFEWHSHVEKHLKCNGSRTNSNLQPSSYRVICLTTGPPGCCTAMSMQTNGHKAHTFGNNLPLMSYPFTYSGTVCNEQWAQPLWFKKKIYQASTEQQYSRRRLWAGICFAEAELRQQCFSRSQMEILMRLISECEATLIRDAISGDISSSSLQDPRLCCVEIFSLKTEIQNSDWLKDSGLETSVELELIKAICCV